MPDRAFALAPKGSRFDAIVWIGSIATELAFRTTSGLPPLTTELRTSREVRKVPQNEPALRERAARGAGAGAADGVTR